MKDTTASPDFLDETGCLILDGFVNEDNVNSFSSTEATIEPLDLDSGCPLLSEEPSEFVTL